MSANLWYVWVGLKFNFLRVIWIDWRGPREEIVEVQCVNDAYYLLRDIHPYRCNLNSDEVNEK